MLAVAVLFFMEGAKPEVQPGRFNAENRGENYVNESGGLESSVGGGSGSSLDSADAGSVSGSVDVPDVSGAECGFYFEEYGVCAGTCPSGVCVSEGRSCYCKS